MTALQTELEYALRERLRGRVLFVGVGNPLRGDDRAGPEVIAMLGVRVNAVLLDVGEVPESYSEKILAARADTIVFLDAANLRAEPGDLAILEIDELFDFSVYTHRMPLSILCQYLKRQSHADIFAVGIQPLQLGLGEPMSATAWNSVEYLAELFTDLLPATELRSEQTAS